MLKYFQSLFFFIRNFEFYLSVLKSDVCITEIDETAKHMTKELCKQAFVQIQKSFPFEDESYKFLSASDPACALSGQAKTLQPSIASFGLSSFNKANIKSEWQNRY
jgi:hypothetical protein